jgi:hypothetical protein
VINGVQNVDGQIARNLLVELRVLHESIDDQTQPLLVDGNIDRAGGHDELPFR